MKGLRPSGRLKMLSLMLLVGTTAALAQNAAGDYTAGTTALGTVTTEIAKYVPYVVKLCYAIQVRALRGEAVLRHRRCRGHRGSHQRVHQDEQRGTGCQEVHHDDSGRLYLPGRRRTGTPVVLRYHQLSHARNKRRHPATGIPHVQGAATAS